MPVYNKLSKRIKTLFILPLSKHAKRKETLCNIKKNGKIITNLKMKTYKKSENEINFILT
jgi:hypothetical protein